MGAQHHGEREKEGFIVSSSRSTHARKHAMMRRAQLFPTKKFPPPDPLVDDATCDDAGGSVTDAHFRVQFNSGDKQGGGSGLTEVRDSSVKERGFLLFAATHMPPLSALPQLQCSLRCVLSFKSRTSHTHSHAKFEKFLEGMYHGEKSNHYGHVS